MNRWLLVPGIGCLLLFVGVLATLEGAARRSASPRDDLEAVLFARVESASQSPQAEASPPLSSEDPKQVLIALTNEYLGAWRQWENSPRRLYSRMAPRPVPTVLVNVEMAPQASESDHFALGTVGIIIGDKPQSYACVVDRLTQHVSVFAEGQWLTQEEWLATAPLP